MNPPVLRFQNMYVKGGSGVLKINTLKQFTDRFENESARAQVSQTCVK